MKKATSLTLTLLLVLFAVLTAHSQENSNANNTSNNTTNANRSTNTNRRRGPVFRASRDQITQAQTILRQRGFLDAEPTGRLDTATRAGLRRYQEAESLRVTGTLNRVTLEKMNITLTERQRAM